MSSSKLKVIHYSPTKVKVYPGDLLLQKDGTLLVVMGNNHYFVCARCILDVSGTCVEEPRLKPDLDLILQNIRTRLSYLYEESRTSCTIAYNVIPNIEAVIRGVDYTGLDIEKQFRKDE